MFHAARALLSSKGVTAKTHRGTISLFSEKIVKQGILPIKFADMFRKVFDLRQKCDYEINARLDVELVREVIENAEEFIKKVKELIKT